LYEKLASSNIKMYLDGILEAIFIGQFFAVNDSDRALIIIMIEINHLQIRSND